MGLRAVIEDPARRAGARRRGAAHGGDSPHAGSEHTRRIIDAPAGTGAVGVKRLLAISWEMPPLSGPRAVQVTRTLASLAEFGWRRAWCASARGRTAISRTIACRSSSCRAAGPRLIPVPSPEEWLLVPRVVAAGPGAEAVAR